MTFLLVKWLKPENYIPVYSKGPFCENCLCKKRFCLSTIVPFQQFGAANFPRGEVAKENDFPRYHGKPFPTGKIGRLFHSAKKLKSMECPFYGC